MYMIYAKHKSEKLARPMDIESGKQVINLLFATCIASKDRAEKIAREIREHAPSYTIEVRKKN